MTGNRQLRPLQALGQVSDSLVRHAIEFTVIRDEANLNTEHISDLARQRMICSRHSGKRVDGRHSLRCQRLVQGGDIALGFCTFGRIQWAGDWLECPAAIRLFSSRLQFALQNESLGSDLCLERVGLREIPLLEEQRDVAVFRVLCFCNLEEMVECCSDGGNFACCRIRIGTTQLESHRLGRLPCLFVDDVGQVIVAGILVLQFRD